MLIITSCTCRPDFNDCISFFLIYIHRIVARSNGRNPGSSKHADASIFFRSCFTSSLHIAIFLVSISCAQRLRYFSVSHQIFIVPRRISTLHGFPMLLFFVAFRITIHHIYKYYRREGSISRGRFLLFFYIVTIILEYYHFERFGGGCLFCNFYQESFSLICIYRCYSFMPGC